LAIGFRGGVIVKNQGIVALGILRDQQMIVGLTHPLGDLVLFDYRTNQLAKVATGIPWRLGNPISRELIVAPSGRIYIYRGTEELKQRDEKHAVWVYDPQKNELTNTGFEITQGFWIGQTQTRDGRKIYVSTTNGELYEFDTLTEKFKDLGYLLPKESIAAGRKIAFMYGVTLSPDEKTLYYAPAVLENPDGSGELYSYEIATGKIRSATAAGGYTRPPTCVMTKISTWRTSEPATMCGRATRGSRSSRPTVCPRPRNKLTQPSAFCLLHLPMPVRSRAPMRVRQPL
jgi:sugar lactone lactonase YvrE